MERILRSEAREFWMAADEWLRLFFLYSSKGAFWHVEAENSRVIFLSCGQD